VGIPRGDIDMAAQVIPGYVSISQATARVWSSFLGRWRSNHTAGTLQNGVPSVRQRFANSGTLAHGCLSMDQRLGGSNIGQGSGPYISHPDAPNHEPSQDSAKPSPRRIDLALFLMANIQRSKTGLPFVVWISQRQPGAPDTELWLWASGNPRFETTDELTHIHCLGPELQVIRIRDVLSGEKKSLQRWVDLNREVLLRHWNGNIDSAEALERIRGVEGGAY